MWGRARKEAQRALAAAQADCKRLTTERDQALALVDQERQRTAAAQAAIDRARADADAVRTGAAATEVEAAEQKALVERLATTPSEAIDRCWPLVLADLTRRWAATVGAQPETRGISEGSAGVQLTEGLSRETERLREEVGVDVSFTITKPVEPTNPVVFLLTATDLLGAMASRCERVTVEIDGQLVLTGEVWTDLGDELDISRSRAVAAGALVDPIEVDEERVRIAVRP